MATQIQIEKYNEYRKKLQELYEYGVSQGLIYPYERDQEFIENLRHIY